MVPAWAQGGGGVLVINRQQPKTVAMNGSDDQALVQIRSQTFKDAGLPLDPFGGIITCWPNIPSQQITIVTMVTGYSISGAYQITLGVTPVGLVNNRYTLKALSFNGLNEADHGWCFIFEDTNGATVEFSGNVRWESRRVVVENF
ncbi:MAG: hypothetical protein V1846_02135 [Candidatus Komeilibacteria bacterium]